MFTQNSWSSYIVTVLLLLGGYYLFIGYRYYRNDLLQLISGKRNTTNDKLVSTQRHQTLIQSFSDEVHAFMEQAVKNKLDKKDIMQSLQLLLQKYPALKDSGLQGSVQNLIINEYASYCSIHLSDEELSGLWN
ncbi:MAG TPA: hypothetical protein VMU83_17530 [Hanamia sp.]|nr:hypothetical protein [Hanamia sp.]